MCLHLSNVSQLCARRAQAHIPACHRVRNMGVTSVLFFLWPMSLAPCLAQSPLSGGYVQHKAEAWPSMLRSSWASLDFSPLGGGSVTPEGGKLVAPEGGKLIAPKGGKLPAPEVGKLVAPEGGKLPASFLPCGAYHFGLCGGVEQTWPFLWFCYGIPLLLTLCALTRMKLTKKKTKCVVAARKSGKSRFR